VGIVDTVMHIDIAVVDVGEDVVITSVDVVVLLVLLLMLCFPL